MKLSSESLEEAGGLSGLLRPLFSQQKKKNNISVREVRQQIENEEFDKLISKDQIIKKAMNAVEQDGIVFIDEIDKICQTDYNGYHADASAEGVQRDLLPIIEGTTINTKYGNIDTSKILFIASGAFHQSKPSDLLAELQGRLPIRVQLKPLSEKDLHRILTEPENNLIVQHQAMLKTEDVHLVFTDSAIREVAKLAYEINQSVENTGARRLHTVLEKIVEDISYDCEKLKGKTVTIDLQDVTKRLHDLLTKADLKRYVL